MHLFVFVYKRWYIFYCENYGHSVAVTNTLLLVLMCLLGFWESPSYWLKVLKDDLCCLLFLILDKTLGNSKEKTLVLFICYKILKMDIGFLVLDGSSLLFLIYVIWFALALLGPHPCFHMSSPWCHKRCIRWGKKLHITTNNQLERGWEHAFEIYKQL